MPRPFPPQRNWLRSLASWLDALALGLWGVLLLKLWLAGQLSLLVHPNYAWLAVAAGFALLMVAGLEGWRVWQRRQYASGELHVTLLLPGWSAGLLLGVALLGLFVPPRPFVSDVALQRGATDILAATRTVPQSFRASNRPEERSLVEWVRTLEVYPEPDAYAGQPVNVNGFVVHPQDLPDNVFLLTRFVITCCAADVYPVSLPVAIEGSRSAYPPDLWLQVSGRMTVTQLKGKRQLAIRPDRLDPIPEPKNPYFY